jgi:hypothetical protein
VAVYFFSQVFEKTIQKRSNIHLFIPIMHDDESVASTMTEMSVSGGPSIAVGSVRWPAFTDASFRSTDHTLGSMPSFGGGSMAASVGEPVTQTGTTPLLKMLTMEDEELNQSMVTPPKIALFEGDWEAVVAAAEMAESAFFSRLN